MNQKEIVKNLIYSGVGISSYGTQRLEKYFEELFADHPNNIEEGKRVIEVWQKKANKMKIELEAVKENLQNSIVDRYNLNREELKILVNDIIEKPTEMRGQMEERIHGLGILISENSSAPREEIIEFFNRFIQEIEQLKQKVKSKSDDLSEEARIEMEAYQKSLKEVIIKIDDKVGEIRHDFQHKLLQITRQFQETLHNTILKSE